MTSGQIEMAALGRPFTLGMLYDACSEELDTGFTLWDKKTIFKLKTQQPQTKSKISLDISDTTGYRNALVEVNESLKVGVLCGLIDTEESVKYLFDMKKSKNQNRIILHYTSTTTMEQLPLSLDEIKHFTIKDLSKHTQATHVVTGILKGANAFFVFDSEKTDETNVQEIKSTIKAEIDKIQSKGEASFQLSEDVKAITDKLSCTFHGDFILKENPATFKDAIKTYSELPKLLGENGENTVPVKVWLTPLKNFFSSAAEVKRDISDDLVGRIKDAQESLTEMDTRCDQALGEEVAKEIPQMEKKLQHFQKLCIDYNKMLQKTMKEIIPHIRRGLEEETSLKKCLDEYEKSPFGKENLENWMKNAADEIDAINHYFICLENVKNIEIVQKEIELKNKALKARSRHSFCFVFTSVESKDPYLDQMEKYLKHQTENTDQIIPPPKDLWFHSEDVCKKMEKKARKMSKYSKFHFLSPTSYFIAALPNNKFEGATIYQYKKGTRISPDFSLSLFILSKKTASSSPQAPQPSAAATADPQPVENQPPLDLDQRHRSDKKMTGLNKIKMHPRKRSRRKKE